MTQLETWALIAQSALNYIFIQAITSSGQKQATLDRKKALRATNEALLSELKDTKKTRKKHCFGKMKARRRQ